MRFWGRTFLAVLILSSGLLADNKPDPIVDGKNLTEWIIESKEPPTDWHVRGAYARLGEFVGEPRAVAALHEAWDKENRYAAWRKSQKLPWVDPNRWELVMSLVKTDPNSHGEMVRWLRQTTLESPGWVTILSVWEKIILALGADAEPLIPTLRQIIPDAGNRADNVRDLIAKIEKAAAEKKAEKKS